MISLDKGLRSHNSRLFVCKGDPVSVLTKKLIDWDVQLVTWESDTEPYAVERDKTIRNMCEVRGVKVQTFVSHTMYDLEELFKKNGNKVTQTYGSF